MTDATWEPSDVKRLTAAGVTQTLRHGVTQPNLQPGGQRRIFRVGGGNPTDGRRKTTDPHHHGQIN